MEEGEGEEEGLHLRLEKDVLGAELQYHALELLKLLLCFFLLAHHGAGVYIVVVQGPTGPPLPLRESQKQPLFSLFSSSGMDRPLLRRRGVICDH